MDGDPSFGRFVTLTDGSWHHFVTKRDGTTHYIIGDGGAVSTSGTVTGSNTMSHNTCRNMDSPWCGSKRFEDRDKRGDKRSGEGDKGEFVLRNQNPGKKA